MNDRYAKERQALKHALDEAGIKPARLSIDMGHSKDYIADYLRGQKDTIGAKETKLIESAIEAAKGRKERKSGDDKGNDHPPHTDCIRISLSDFREEVLATLRSVRVSSVLARERFDDLLLALRELALNQPPPALEATLHIELVSPNRSGEALRDRENDK